SPCEQSRGSTTPAFTGEGLAWGCLSTTPVRTSSVSALTWTLPRKPEICCALTWLSQVFSISSATIRGFLSCRSALSVCCTYGQGLAKHTSQQMPLHGVFAFVRWE